MPEKRWLLLEGEEIDTQEKLIEDAIQAHVATHKPSHRPPFALSSIRHKLRAPLAPQPPAPVLSDEERERLKRISDFVAQQAKPPYAEDRRWQDAQFLRTLASQEPRGEE